MVRKLQADGVRTLRAIAAAPNERGVRTIALSPSPDCGVTNLHAFWDMTAVNALGNAPPT